MIALLRSTPAEQRLIPSAGLKGPVPVLIAIMVFVMMIVAAAGLALAGAATVVGQGIESRYSIQIADGSGKAPAALDAARRSPGVVSARQVADADMRRTLERWLGPDASKADLPLPALIDVDVRPGADPAAIAKAVQHAVPEARFVAHRETLSPILSTLRGLGWLAATMVILIGLASGAAVILAARGALDTHRATVEVMHGLGATDRQIARLFQRQIALDALVGALAGAAIAGMLLGLLVGGASFASDLAGRPLLLWRDAAILAALPFVAAALATMVARRAVIGALRERL
ncbi:cell division protein FtsX [Sphingomonas jaspsi]|uniref:cell division protein FtsX n=1 Tax=Sphingomonas jaspsi TaxID=392409 RepID=UPI0004BB3096|nr:FtsX-like permease family protein [Sphingomonas jaspsi]